MKPMAERTNPEMLPVPDALNIDLTEIPGLPALRWHGTQRCNAERDRVMKQVLHA